MAKIYINQYLCNYPDDCNTLFNYTKNLYGLVSSWVADTFSSDEETEQRKLDDF